ncbi:hypothetical protein [Caulobacter sp. NIBR1757]|uniref:hypothetical protein n=1 Tax=Caulobacter sp. NIBR1757 TaxID=3016000 RepID=UPI0022F00E8C|nr:hypothetical protein [Caulobacter sp. NIBR1757]WGM37719.1 hypothetical protein AMEJIAPC_00619 [Caulobacter sp. NIBR1757]
MTTLVVQGEAGASLPAAYATFAPILGRLSEPMQQVLRGLLVQLERSLTSYDAPRLRPQGEFEGLGGLARNGDIGHILQSELLLRSEAPLEFLRRLADGETLFLEKQYADPGVRPVYRALVSVGPGLLGHGRILALAALFYLARLAAQRGADFHWCFLPREDGAVWFEGLTVPGVTRMLKAASFREMEVGDLEEAVDLWSRLSSEPPETVDWVIGARPRRTAAGSAPAIEAAANALAFTLGPPIAGARRTVRVAMRLAGQARAGLELVFPDDRVCVSALNDPFRPLDPARLPAASQAAEERNGWAPRGMAAAGGQSRFVRLADGLLLLFFRKETEVAMSYFFRLPKDAILAGVQLDNSVLRVLLYSRRSGEGVFHGSDFLLQPRGSFTPWEPYRLPVMADQLFKDHAPNVIPPMQVIPSGRRFRSASGGAFDLDRSAQGIGAFKPRRDVSPLLSSDGFHSLQLEETGERRRLIVLKQGSPMAGGYPVDDADLRIDRLVGMRFLSGEQALAVGQQGRRWTILPFQSPVEDTVSRSSHTVVLAPEDRLVAGRWRWDGAVVRLWSDVRRGGKGTIRYGEVRNGVVGYPTATYKLGDDAASLIKLEPGLNGYWGLTVDAKGEPDLLVHYRPNRKTSTLIRTAFSLRGLADAAPQIDLEQLLA